jgi:hypothetical protein
MTTSFNHFCVSRASEDEQGADPTILLKLVGFGGQSFAQYGESRNQSSVVACYLCIQTRRREAMISRRTIFRAAAASMAAATGTAAMASGHITAPSSSINTAASQVGVCATCKFWGGVRRVSPDKQTVYSESLGWCNNSASPNFQKKTTPISGPMKMWQKWDALT